MTLVWFLDLKFLCEHADEITKISNLPHETRIELARE